MNEVLDLEIAAQVREVTDEEVAFFNEHGWAMLRDLVTLDLAAEMSRVVERSKASATPLVRAEQHTTWWQLGDLARRGVEPFSSFLFSAQMGRNAQRLSNRERLSGASVAMRYHHDGVNSKEPSGPRTGYHQDATIEGSDRGGQVNFWLALDEVTPEMGAMRFITGAHREGPLGSDVELLEYYPSLLDIYELSPPFHYQPGDATVHTGYMPHGGPPNTTSRARRAYIFGYVPVDTRYINGQAIRPGIDRHPPDESEHPTVYPLD